MVLVANFNELTYEEAIVIDGGKNETLVTIGKVLCTVGEVIILAAAPTPLGFLLFGMAQCVNWLS